MVKKGILLGIGNPLLDISVHGNAELLARYNLKSDDAILYEKEDLFLEISEDYDAEYIAGGSTQNSIRIAQVMIGEDCATTYFGCVGLDDSARIMKKIASHAGVKVVYQINQDLPTGKCAVIITGQSRSLVTKLDAANHFTESHLDNPENWALVEQAEVFYSAGFFLTVSPTSMLRVAEYAAGKGKKFCMNLSAPFLCEFYSDPMMLLMPFCDVIFGNETEALALAEKHKYGTKQIAEIASRIAMHPKRNGSSGRIVVITQGHDCVVVVENGKVSEHEVIAIPLDKIVDTNGAGDAFVGGFLVRYIEGCPVAECVKTGCWTASQIIRSSGCTFPKDLTEDIKAL